MSFVNEYIPNEDVARYDIEAIDRRFFAVTYRPHWTVDRETSTYLRHVASGREESSSQHDFTFYWNERLLVVRLESRADGERHGTGRVNYKLLSLDLPEDQGGRRAEILTDLKAALIAYGGGGVHSTWKTTDVTFEF